MTLAFEPGQSHRLVDEALASHPMKWDGLDRAIDARDEMLQFAVETARGDRDAALGSYFLTALELHDLVRWCARSHFGDAAPVPAMLDFASGYGRLTRFLVHSRLATELHVSDILDGAMAFQAERFGVRTIRSATNPDELALDRSYDLVMVASLFTHLPESTFRAWLDRLVRVLTANGILVFSVHDESLVGLTLGDGLHFQELSESRTLDVRDYGSTWVSEAFVRRTLAAIDPELRCARLPRALGGFQDVYVAGRTLDAARMESREIVHCFFENCEPSADGVQLSGWACEETGPVDRIEIRLDGETAAIREFGERPDVAASLGIPETVPAGWAFAIPAGRIRSYHDQVVSITAVGRGGVRRTAFIGSVDTARAVGLDWQKRSLMASQHALGEQLRVLTGHVESLSSQLSALQQVEASLREDLARATATIEHMRRSRFWKAREAWFRFKRRAGLPSD